MNRNQATAPTRNRIKCHRKIRAGDLVPHELNPRLHSQAQREALAALYADIGFARSLLVYELPDGRYKLIDGHLRRNMDPDMEVDVEVLDVNDTEARALLLSIDPLARLAEYDHEVVAELRRITVSDSDALNNLWQTLAQDEAAVQAVLEKSRKEAKEPALPEQFLILIECESEAEQVALLRRFQNEGLSCQAKTV